VLRVREVGDRGRVWGVWRWLLLNQEIDFVVDFKVTL